MIKNNKIEEEKFLNEYDASLFTRPNTSIDTVIFTILNGELHILILKRADHPFKDNWSLIGGYVDTDKDHDIKATAKRKLEEKTGVKTSYLEQYGTIGNATRDPRGWSITTIYFALLASNNILLTAGTGATDIKWAKVANGIIEEKLAFDHDTILSSCLDRLRSKVLYTSLPTHLVPEKFTLGELQKVYEIILSMKIDHKSFRRRILNADILAETLEMRYDGKKPAKLFRLKQDCKTHFFIRNIEGAS